MAAIFDTPIHTGARNLERVLATGRPVLLVFETPGCQPCAGLVPALEDVARGYAGKALVARVDDAQEGGLAERFRLARVPTLVFWRDGREVTRLEGAVPANAIRAHLDYVLDSQQPRPAPATGPSVPLPGAVPPPPPPRPSPQAAPGPAPYASSPGAARPDGGSVVVTDATFEAQVLRSPVPVVVDFWAPWCGPCRMVSPIVEELGREYAGRMRVAKMNTDEDPKWAGKLGVRGIPTLIFFKDGREVDRVVGAAPKGTLKTYFERALQR